MQGSAANVAAALEAYEVGDELGRGAWGVVLAGRHRRLGREVAIKQLPAAFASDPGVRARFLAEGRQLASLDHPHVVPVYDYVEHGEMCLLVMERLHGGTVADRVRGERLTPEVACGLALAACSGLHHAHERGVLHRDIKPENLLFAASGALKVADFGIAKVLGGAASTATVEGSVLGTPAFMSPEQVQGDELTPATDVYALGTTLYWLLARRLPFPADGDAVSVMFRHVHEEPGPLRAAASELPPRLCEVVDAALARDPGDRIASAQDLGLALAGAAAEEWGAGWLDASGVVLASAGPIADAARGGAGDARLATVVSTAPAGELDRVERGRALYETGTWRGAFETLATADRDAPLQPEDLERLARAAYMLGRDDDYADGLERAHHAYLEAGNTARAANCAFWIGHNAMFRGNMPRGRGWMERAQRLLEDAEDCAERGYMLIPAWLQQMGAGDFDAGFATAVEAAEIGERFGDADLMWLARMDQGRALVQQGRTQDGLRLVDEALVAATAGELSPIVTGIVYCNTIIFCRDAYELRHAHEWTEALTRWCEAQPEMVAHNGLCLVHRAEMIQLKGGWTAALAEAERVTERFTEGVLNERALGTALYRQGEVHRLLGELAEAEGCYTEASRHGFEPQPGLALLRLAEGKPDAAAAAIRRATMETTKPLSRAALLPAQAEIMLAVGDLEAARGAYGELEEIAERQGSEALTAMAEHARGAVALAEGDPAAALAVLRAAFRAWQELEAPYEAARARELLGLACRALGDEDSAALELDAAREVFERLGAATDLARLGPPGT